MKLVELVRIAHRLEEIAAIFDTYNRGHIHLSVLAGFTPIAETHIDLAMFSEQQARVAKELCEK